MIHARFQRKTPTGKYPTDYKNSAQTRTCTLIQTNDTC